MAHMAGVVSYTELAELVVAGMVKFTTASG